jgi:hypothetical protein
MKNPWKISTLVLAVLLGVVLGTPSLQNVALADRQPAMEKALDHLEAAKDALQNATEDKGGHRVKAIKFVKKAINQVEAGIKYDNRN